MPLRIALLAATLTASLAPAAVASVEGPERGRQVALVANAEDGTVSILDARSFRMLRSLNVVPDGIAPSAATGDPPLAPLNHALITGVGGVNVAQDLDLSPDGRMLYVSRGHRGDVAAFDLATGAMRWKLAVPGLRADHMTISDDGRRLFVSAMTANVVVAIDTAAHAIVASARTGQWPHDNHVSHGRLYNSSIGTIVVPDPARAAIPPAPYQLTVLDPATMRVLRAFSFDRGIRPTAFTADGRTMYAQRSLESSVMRVRLADGRIERIGQLPVRPGTTEEDYDFEAPHHGLALSGDERTLCVAGRVSDYAALVDAATLRPRAIVPVPDAPGWAATTPDGRHCVLANNRADNLSVVSYATGREVARVRGGDGPKLIEAARIPERVLCTSSATPGCSGRMRLSSRCLRGGRVRVRLSGDLAAVERVRFQAGRVRSRPDTSPPYVATVRLSRRARRAPGRVRAAVTLSDSSRTLSRRRPRCR
jgi:DNA-binding beta-propeller fold protein YncE